MRVANYSKLFVLLLIFTILIMVSHVYAVEEVLPQVQNENTAKLVGKINFDEVLKQAKKHAYDLKIADYNVLISKQGVRSAKSEYFPKLNLMAGTEYTRNFRDIHDTTIMSIGDAFINPYTRYQSIIGITVGYNLFDFGARSDSLKMAKEDVKVKELEFKQKLQEMNLTLLDSYSKILITTKQIELNRDILALEEKNLEMKERLYKAKEIAKTELNSAKANVSKTKIKISDLKSIREDSINWLSFYTGVNYETDNIKVDEIQKANFDILSFQDYTKCITWQIQEKNIKKKELELSIAKKNYLPKVNVYGRYYLYGSNHNNYGKALGIEPSNFSIGASVNMPVFDGFKNNSIVEKTALELKQLYVERDKAIAQYTTRLASMRTNLLYLDEQLEENKKTIEELTDKEKSVHKLAAKKIITPIDENDVKIELLNQKIEQEKNSITQNAITRGIQILTEEIKN